MSKYSKAELRIFRYFGLENIINFLPPSQIYQAAVNEAFLSADIGKYSNALRVAYGNFCNLTIRRGTKEFDDAILEQLEE